MRLNLHSHGLQTNQPQAWMRWNKGMGKLQYLIVNQLDTLAESISIIIFWGFFSYKIIIYSIYLFSHKKSLSQLEPIMFLS